MKRIVTYGLVAVMLAYAAAPLSAGNTYRTVLEKGEKTAGAGILFADFDNNGSEFLLLANDIGANGNLFHVKPYLSYAYRDNASLGVRLAFTSAQMNLANADLRLFSDDMAATLKDMDGRWCSFGGGLFHRNYIGLDDSGTFGLFCEFELSFTHSILDYGKEQYNSVNRFGLNFNPGIIVYIMPMVSAEISIGFADISYIVSTSHDDGNPEGIYGRFSGGTRFNLLNCSFGISYHF